ncbi:MAG: hypothetical protein B7Y95_16325 [Rhizobiales bacterium 32-66-11]|nr:MAG: hypothetical protein B7Y95_16325 [Rhizobiales bacterium 32-66-11]
MARRPICFAPIYFAIGLPRLAGMSLTPPLSHSGDSTGETGQPLTSARIGLRCDAATSRRR